MSKINASVIISLEFDSEYPDSIKQELESVLYNSLISHKKISNVNIGFASIITPEMKSMSRNERRDLHSRLIND